MTFIISHDQGRSKAAKRPHQEVEMEQGPPTDAPFERPRRMAAKRPPADPLGLRIDEVDERVEKLDKNLSRAFKSIGSNV
jgi:hypothetical protein